MLPVDQALDPYWSSPLSIASSFQNGLFELVNKTRRSVLQLCLGTINGTTRLWPASLFSSTDNSNIRIQKRCGSERCYIYGNFTFSLLVSQPALLRRHTIQKLMAYTLAKAINHEDNKTRGDQTDKDYPEGDFLRYQ